MASRFWVGGTDNWNAVGGWSATSGGAGGASVPTAADDVFFDAASGAAVVTITAASTCLALNCTGFTGELTGAGTLFVNAAMILVAGMTYTATSPVTFQATTAGPHAVTFAGKNVSPGGILAFNGVGGAWTVTDNWACPTTDVQLIAGALNVSTRTLTIRTFDGFNAGVAARSLDFSDSIWLLQGGASNEWVMGTLNLTSYNAAGSDIRLVNVGVVDKTFAGGGLNYNLVKFTGGGTGSFVVSGNNSIAEWTLSPGIFVTCADTQTIDVLLATGTAGNLISIEATSPVNQCIFSRADNRVICDYLDLARVRAQGGARWFAGRHSVNSGGNNGWIFTDALIAPSSIVAGVGI